MNGFFERMFCCSTNPGVEDPQQRRSYSDGQMLEVQPLLARKKDTERNRASKPLPVSIQAREKKVKQKASEAQRPLSRMLPESASPHPLSQSRQADEEECKNQQDRSQRPKSDRSINPLRMCLDKNKDGSSDTMVPQGGQSGRSGSSSSSLNAELDDLCKIRRANSAHYDLSIKESYQRQIGTKKTSSGKKVKKPQLTLEIHSTYSDDYDFKDVKDCSSPQSVTFKSGNSLDSGDHMSQQSGLSVESLPFSSPDLNCGDEQSQSSQRFDEHQHFTIANSQFIGEQVSGHDEECTYIFSPIVKNQLWSQSKLLKAIQNRNVDPDYRRLTQVFRSERRQIFGEGEVDITTFRNCCQLLDDELDEVTKRSLGDDYFKYEKALQFYQECLIDHDIERLPFDSEFQPDIPYWLTNDQAEAISREITAYQASELKQMTKRKSRPAHKSLFEKLARYRTQDYLYFTHGIEIEQLNRVLESIQSTKSKSGSSSQRGGFSLDIDVDSASGDSGQSSSPASYKDVQDQDVMQILLEVSQKKSGKLCKSPKNIKNEMLEKAKRQADQNYMDFSQRNLSLNGQQLPPGISPSNRKKKTKRKAILGRFSDINELMQIPNLDSIVEGSQESSQTPQSKDSSSNGHGFTLYNKTHQDSRAKSAAGQDFPALFQPLQQQRTKTRTFTGYTDDLPEDLLELRMSKSQALEKGSLTLSNRSKNRMSSASIEF